MSNKKEVSFKLKKSSGSYQTEVTLKYKNKDDEDVREDVKVKYYDGVVVAKGQRLINYFNDRDDHVNISVSDEILQDTKEQLDTAKKENTEMKERLSEYEGGTRKAPEGSGEADLIKELDEAKNKITELEGNLTTANEKITELEEQLDEADSDTEDEDDSDDEGDPDEEDDPDLSDDEAGSPPEEDGDETA